MYSLFYTVLKPHVIEFFKLKKIKDISIKMFIDKEEEEKKAKELEKNAVAITWDLLVFEDVWSFILIKYLEEEK